MFIGLLVYFLIVYLFVCLFRFGFVTFSNEWEAQKAKDSSDDERTLEGRYYDYDLDVT